MRRCGECGGPLYSGNRPYQIDEFVCRECQRSPAVQMRVLLDNARARALTFDQAWDFSWARIRWPHDTTHRREWKTILTDEKQRKVWSAAYRREPAKQAEKNLAHLALAA